MRSIVRAKLLLICLVLAGCGSASREDVPTTVRGRVTVQGRPMAGGMIVFAPHPEYGGKGRAATAEIDANGEYELTFDGGKTIAPGWYRVALADPPYWTTVAPGDAPRLSAVSGFPEALRRPDRSGLEREVISGKQNEFEFHIEVEVK